MMLGFPLMATLSQMYSKNYPESGRTKTSNMISRPT